MKNKDAVQIAKVNLRLFICFRMLFNARFYYPIYALLFLEHGLSWEEFGILNGIWAITIIVLEVPSGALADTLGRKKLLVLAAVCMMVEMLFLGMFQNRNGSFPNASIKDFFLIALCEKNIFHLRLLLSFPIE